MSFYTNPSVRTGLPPFNPPVQVLPDDVVHTEPFHPSTSELLYLLNSEHYNKEMTTATDASTQHIVDDDSFTVTEAIAVPCPSLDIVNLPLHVILPDTDPDRDHFATDEDVSPNDPAFLRKVIAHRRGLKRATEISKGQFLLQLGQ
ncbi:hypothetical protein Moror_14412 [Moniliophthora roreri MCA 2997]|uniref:Uncharacterized protein n=1 Tax=Moniliophthora roreri (strain MCA 2997) TaxID=1381753 RepID=V2WI48_MONRO|nr:hypothetical protein Moror_14412 [Moniliophthora roreri MCA 2997]